MICETPDCGQVALSVLTTTCGVHRLCGSCVEQIWGIETQRDEVSRVMECHMPQIDHEQVDSLIEIWGIYDGWSVARMKGGSLVNRWEPGDLRYQPTQDWIDKFSGAENVD